MMDKNNSETCNLFTVKNTPSGARRDTPTECFYFIEYSYDYDDNDNNDSLQYNSISDVFEMIYDLLDDVFIHMICGGYIYKMYSNGRKKRIYTIVADTDVTTITFVRIRE